MKLFSHRKVYSTYKMDVSAKKVTDVSGYWITLRKPEDTGN